MTKKLFGTDGVRGVANVYPMTAEFAVKLGMACGQEICRNKRRAAIGRDTRISGEMLEAGLTAGLTAAGIDVVKLGVLPTPAVTSVTPELGVDMSFMITASHNPYQDNGIKLITAEGDKFSDEVTSRLEELIAADSFELEGCRLGTVSENKEAVVLYLEKAKSFIESDRPLKGLRVVLDCANGVFADIMPQVFKDLGAGVIALGNRPDGCNINKDCGSQHPEKMFETVRDAHAHLGIAVDGDGDRIIVCNEKGEKVASERGVFDGAFQHRSGALRSFARHGILQHQSRRTGGNCQNAGSRLQRRRRRVRSCGGCRLRQNRRRYGGRAFAQFGAVEERQENERNFSAFRL